MKSKHLVVSVIAVAGAIFLYYAFSGFVYLYTALKTYNERQVRKNDYTQMTTPLKANVIKDICVKFEISTMDKRCQPDAIVYSPEFFDDIKAYLRYLPNEEKTYQNVQDKLVNYLIECERPDNEGVYRCHYDLHGDRLYQISIYFSRDGSIYRVMDNRGGS